MTNKLRQLYANPPTLDHSHDVKLAGIHGACYVFVPSTHPHYKDYPVQPHEAYGYIMQRAGLLKAHYTPEDIAQRLRFVEMPAIQDGEHVMVDGIECIVHIRGNYSDAATLTPVNDERE